MSITNYIYRYFFFLLEALAAAFFATGAWFVANTRGSAAGTAGTAGTSASLA
jgi:hypothetical protein